MNQHQIIGGDGAAYLLIMFGGILVGALFWARRFREDQRLILIYAFGIASAFAGAKIGYLIAEGWLYRDDPHFLLYLANGKTILGALLGGYGGVEFGKWITGYAKPTGDWFAGAVPFGVAAGRVGCLLHGCCLGREQVPAWYTIIDQAGLDRWPAPGVEMAFNLVAAASFHLMRHRHMQKGQHFHLYLISYGIFRFGHEFVRDTPRILGSFSGYQLLALGVTTLGAIGYRLRQKQPAIKGPS